MFSLSTYHILHGIKHKSTSVNGYNGINPYTFIIVAYGNTGIIINFIFKKKVNKIDR